MKKNNDSIHFKDWTNKKLKDEWQAYRQLIDDIGCYGTKDVQNFYAIGYELGRRGISIH